LAHEWTEGIDREKVFKAELELASVVGKVERDEGVVFLGPFKQIHT
jgi:hypothetical protein